MIGPLFVALVWAAAACLLLAALAGPESNRGLGAAAVALAAIVAALWTGAP